MLGAAQVVRHIVVCRRVGTSWDAVSGMGGFRPPFSFFARRGVVPQARCGFLSNEPRERSSGLMGIGTHSLRACCTGNGRGQRRVGEIQRSMVCVHFARRPGCFLRFGLPFFFLRFILAGASWLDFAVGGLSHEMGGIGQSNQA